MPPYYDSLIGKLIVHGRNRVECLMRLKRALDEFVVDGVLTTIPLFQAARRASRRFSTAPTTSAGSKITWRRARREGIDGDVAALARQGQDVITPSLLLRAYACGIFPMADSADDPTLYWVEPEIRGVLPLDRFHVPRRLARTVRADLFEIWIDRDFEAVIAGCATPRAGRQATWINAPIRRLYGALFRAGHVHTVEAWREGRLVGGLYGVKLGAAFFGESMFSDERDASKVALVHLVARLRRGGFRLLDAQFLTAHLAQFGAVEMPRDDYVQRLDAALAEEAAFSTPGDRHLSGAAALALL